MEKRNLGDYTLIKQIGQGSLGTVFLAEHRFMKSQYVLKILPEELATDRNFIQRFEEDVAQIASLDHPHIVKIHNVSYAQGAYFLVLDCVVDEMGETTNLAQYMLARGRKFEEENLLRLLRQIAEALDYAHKVKGQSHHNLKLNNILIGKGKQGIDLYLTDFGLSRIIGSGSVLTRTFRTVAESLGIGSAAVGKGYPVPAIEHSKLTPLHSSFLQSFAFLAPEQKKLDPHADLKSDVYAFGVLAYNLLTGEFPEGLFSIPLGWESLLSPCLQSNPAKRPDALLPLIEALQTRTVQPQQMQVIVEKFVMQPAAVAPLPEPVFATAAAVVGSMSVQASPRPVLHEPQIKRPELDIDPAAVFNIDTTVKQYVPERKEVSNIQPLMTEMFVIKGDVFSRGSSDGNRDEMPRHQVTLSSFAIDVHPVTNEQFVRFLEVMGGEKDSNHNDIIRLRDSRIKRSAGKLTIESGYAKHPVVGVTWYGAVSYAKWVGKRLPTEAEWEVAARGGLESAYYPSGDEIEKSQANFFSFDTTAVMSYAPNAYGLFDVAGNVYEWCQDWYGYNYYELSLQEPENPQGPLQGVYRVLRGGCWKSLKEDLRCSRRHRNNPGTVNGTYGFRCAADAE